MGVNDKTVKQLLLAEAKSKPHEKIFFGGVSFTYGELALILEGKTDTFSDEQRVRCLNAYVKKLIKSFKKVARR
jgi:hypothetical protein